MYCAFLSRGRKLLRDNGCIAYIVPNQFLYQDYAIPLRELFSLSDNILQIADLGNTTVFDDATVMTCVVTVQKNSPPFGNVIARVSTSRFLKSLEEVSAFQVPQKLFTELPNYR